MTPTKGPTTGRTQLIAVRLEHETLKRLDEVAAKLALPGLEVTRSDAIKAAIAAGLPALEERSGLGRPQPRRRK